MNSPRFVALLLGLVALAPLAHASTGPYAGVLRQGEAQTHFYDNNPSGQPCIQLATWYTVRLTYAPASDVLALRVGNAEVLGSNGYAGLTFMSGVCTSFDVVVEGVSVADGAAYVVTVSGGLLGGGGDVIAWG